MTRDVEAAEEGVRYPGVGKMLLFWSAIGAFTSARHQLASGGPRGGGEFLPMLLGCMVYFYPWALLAPLVFRLEAKYPLGGRLWPRHLLVLAAVSIPLCLAAAPAMLGAYVAVRSAFGETPWMPPTPLGWLRELLVAEASFWSCLAAGYFLRTLSELHQQKHRAARLELEKTRLEASLNQSQLEVLRARLNPHFLFNSLQNISMLTRRDPETASAMLAQLGDLLRAVLRRDSQPESTLREELDLTRSYVALEQMRFSDRLRVTFEVADSVQQAMVPCFLMQPLIENAIIHGLRGAGKTGLILVRAAEEDGRLLLTVTDNGAGLPTSDAGALKVGVGLGSTCERLARMYPDRHSFSIRKPPEGGTEVRITLPLQAAGSVHPNPLHEQVPAAYR